MNLDNPQEKLRQVVLCFLIRDNEVLLAMKKRGFGVGNWNGTGGKLKEGETLKQAAFREAKEEIGVAILSLNKMAILDFYFPKVPKEKDWDQQVHVFLVDKWEGKPSESEEMKPQWFKKKSLPLTKMWESDSLWLPKVLQEEKKLRGKLIYDEDQKLIDHQLKEVNRFS